MILFHKIVGLSYSPQRISMWLVTCVLSLLATSALSQAFEVSYKGCVASEKTIQVIDKISLFQLLQNAELTNCAFLFGASVSQTDRVQAQQRIKVDLLKILDRLLSSAETPSSAQYFERLQGLITSQTVTGRLLNIDLEPFHVEMQPLKNRMLTSDSTLYFPSRPNRLNLIGFEVDSIAYDSSLDLSNALSRYKICDACNSGWVWIVQPNTTIEKVKVGLWTHEKHYAAPGAWVISPLSDGEVNDVSVEFYQLLTTWLATQEVK